MFRLLISFDVVVVVIVVVVSFIGRQLVRLPPPPPSPDGNENSTSTTKGFPTPSQKIAKRCCSAAALFFGHRNDVRLVLILMDVYFL